MNTSDQIALGAIIVGSVALIISLRANRISSRALELATQTYFAERRIALKSEHTSDRLVLSPVVAEQTVNNLTMYFPKKLGIAPIALASSDLQLFDTRVAPQLRDYWDSKTPESPGHAVVRENASIPVVVVVHGHTKGVASVTTAFYDLYAQYMRRDKQSSVIAIKGMALNNYAAGGDEPQELADRVISELEAALFDAQTKSLTAK